MSSDGDEISSPSEDGSYYGLCYVETPHVLNDLPSHTAEELELISRLEKRRASQTDGLGRHPLHWVADRSVNATKLHFQAAEALIRACPASVRSKDGFENLLLPVAQRTSLHYLGLRSAAASEWSAKIFHAILAADADAPREIDLCNQFPLHCLASGSRQPTEHNVNMLQGLLKIHRDAAKSEDKAGRLPLHLFLMNSAKATECSVEMLKLLLGAHPDSPSTVTQAGRTPLTCLLQGSENPTEHNVQMLQMLLESCRDVAGNVDEDGRFPLLWLAEHATTGKTTEHSWEMFNAALHGCPTAASSRNEDGEHLLHSMAKCKGTVTELFARMFLATLKQHQPAATEVDKHGATPLHALLSARQNPSEHRIRCVEALLDANSEAALVADGSGVLPLAHVVAGKSGIEGAGDDFAEDSWRLFELIVRKCPRALTSTDAAGHNLLHSLAKMKGEPTSHVTRVFEAVAKNHPDACKTADGMGRLPLHWMAANVSSPAQLKLFETLFSSNPDAASTPDSDGKCPLSMLVEELGCEMTAERFKAFERLLDTCPRSATKDDANSPPFQLHSVLQALARGCLRATEHGWAAFRAVLEADPTTAERLGDQGKRALDYMCEAVSRGAHGDTLQLEFSVHSVDIIGAHYWERVERGLSLEDDGTFSASSDFRGATTRGWTNIELVRGPEPSLLLTEEHWKHLEMLYSAYPPPAVDLDPAGKHALIACLSESETPVAHLEALLKAFPDRAQSVDKHEQTALHCLLARSEDPQVELFQRLFAVLLNAPMQEENIHLEEVSKKVSVPRQRLRMRRKDEARLVSASADVKVRAVHALLAAFPLAAEAVDSFVNRPVSYLARDLRGMTDCRVKMLEVLLSKCPQVVQQLESGDNTPLHLMAAGCIGATEQGWQAMRMLLQAHEEAASWLNRDGCSALGLMSQAISVGQEWDKVRLEFSVHSAGMITDENSLPREGEEGVASACVDDDKSVSFEHFRIGQHLGWTTLDLVCGPEPPPVVTDAHWSHFESLFAACPQMIFQALSDEHLSQALTHKKRVVSVLASSADRIPHLKRVLAVLPDTKAAANGAKLAFHAFLQSVDKPACEVLTKVLSCLVGFHHSGPRRPSTNSSKLSEADHMQLFEALLAAQQKPVAGNMLGALLGEGLSQMTPNKFKLFEALFGNVVQQEDGNSSTANESLVLAAAKGCREATDEGWKAFSIMLNHSRSMLELREGGRSLVNLLCERSGGAGPAALQVFETLLQADASAAVAPDRRSWTALHFLADASMAATEQQWRMFSALVEANPGAVCAQLERGLDLLRIVCRRSQRATEYNVKMLMCVLEKADAECLSAERGLHPLHLIAADAKEATSHTVEMFRVVLQAAPHASSKVSDGAVDPLIEDDKRDGEAPLKFGVLDYLVHAAESGTEHHHAMLMSLLDARFTRIASGDEELAPLVEDCLRTGLLSYLQHYLEAEREKEPEGAFADARSGVYQALVILYVSTPVDPSKLRDVRGTELLKRLQSSDLSVIDDGDGFTLFGSAAAALIPAPMQRAHLGLVYADAEKAWRRCLVSTLQGVTWLASSEGHAYLRRHEQRLDCKGLGITKMVDPLEASVQQRSDLVDMPLTVMDVSQNPDVDRLPLGLCEIACLKTINCDECPKIKSPPKEIISQGGEAVVQFLRALYKDGTRNQEMLLFLIGNGEAGKTSVKNALMAADDTSPKIEEDARSVGISVTLWALPDDKQLSFKILDLAGQAVYASTNQFFLTPRAIYILVWRAKQVDLSLPANQRPEFSPEAMVESWMDLLQFRVPGASVAVVVTHIDQVDADSLDEQCGRVRVTIQERVRRMKVALNFLDGGESTRVNCLEGLGVSELRNKLVEFGKSRPWYDEYLPKKWLQLQQKLRADAEVRPYISWSEYADVASDLELEADDLPTVTKFLNETGSIRYFGDYGLTAANEGEQPKHKDLEFSSTVYVSPPWIIGVMKGLIRHNHENLRRFFLSLEDEDLGLEMERMTRKLVVRGILHAVLVPFLWPSLSKTMPTPHGKLCKQYWDSVLADDSTSDEKEVWSDQRIVSTQADLDAAISLLDGFNLAGRVSETEWIVPLMMMKGGAVSVDKDALSVAGCAYRTEIHLSLLPPGLVEGLMVRLRKRSNFGEMSPVHAVFCSRGSTVKVQVVQSDDAQGVRLMLMADTKKMSVIANAEFQHLIRFYPGLDHFMKATNADDEPDPTDVVVVYHPGVEVEIPGKTEEEAASVLRSKLVECDSELVTFLLSADDDTPGEDFRARVALVLLDEKFQHDDQCLRHFRWACRYTSCVIPVLVKGFKTRHEKTYDSWWPESMEELRSHSLFADCRKEVKDWAVEHVYSQIMRFIEERSRWKQEQIDDQDVDGAMTECAGCIREHSPNPGVLYERDLKAEFGTWRRGGSKDGRLHSCNHKFAQHVLARVAGKTGSFPCPTCVRLQCHPQCTLDAKEAVGLVEDWFDLGRKKKAFQQVQSQFQNQPDAPPDQQAAQGVQDEADPARLTVKEKKEDDPARRRVAPVMQCGLEHAVQVLDLIEHSIMGNTDMVPCFRCVEEDSPAPGQFSRSKILEEHRASLAPAGSLGEETKVRATEACGMGHRVNVEDILSQAAICKALPCPRCQAHGSVPPGWFKRDACLLCRADNVAGSSGVMVCCECHKAGRDPRVPVVEILKPEVFLSYDWGVNRQNQPKVVSLHRSIELKTGLYCWMDVKGGMGAGQSEKVEMRKAVQGSTVVVVFFSAKYLSSDNCLREIAHALLWQKHILPVLLPDWGTDLQLPDTRLEPLDYHSPDHWWKYAKTFGKPFEPDSRNVVPWGQLERFKPISLGDIDMGQSDQDIPSACKREIIDRVFQRFHRSSPAMQEAEAAFLRLRNTMLHDLKSELTRHHFDPEPVFDQLDTDASGDISFEELRAWGEGRDWKFTDANLRRLYCELPQSERGMVDKAAFAHYCLSFTPSTHAARPVSRSGRPMSSAGRPMSSSGRPMSSAGRPMSSSGRPMSNAGRPTSRGGRTSRQPAPGLAGGSTSGAHVESSQSQVLRAEDAERTPSGEGQAAEQSGTVHDEAVEEGGGAAGESVSSAEEGAEQEKGGATATAASDGEGKTASDVKQAEKSAGPNGTGGSEPTATEEADGQAREGSGRVMQGADACGEGAGSEREEARMPPTQATSGCCVLQ